MEKKSHHLCQRHCLRSILSSLEVSKKVSFEFYHLRIQMNVVFRTLLLSLPEHAAIPTRRRLRDLAVDVADRTMPDALPFAFDAELL